MAGSDFLDTISEAYQSKGARDEFRRILVANVYVWPHAGSTEARMVRRRMSEMTSGFEDELAEERFLITQKPTSQKVPGMSFVGSSSLTSTSG
jgi:hypothetical protein